MSKATVVKAVNDQIAKEFYAAYLYLSMATYCEAAKLPGFGHWMRLQYREELSHAERLINFLLDNSAKVELQAIPKPPARFKGAMDIMKQSLAHEQKVTASINKLYALAVREKDYPAQLMLQWFIDEQVEEEKSVSDIIAKLELAGDSGAALLMLDRELAGREAE